MSAAMLPQRYLRDVADLRGRLEHVLGDSFQIVRELGGGGMSRVFVALDTALGREIVIKVLAPDLAAGVDAERFERETQLAARLQHSYIVPLLSAGVVDGLPYYTMPYVEGESLRARLARTTEMPAAEAARILRDVAEALTYAHERGVVHRDVKPANILLTSYHAHVADFGIAKAMGEAAIADGNVTLTTAGFAVGTPAYMAPEQAAGDPATDHRADIYSFGVVAYECLAGTLPFSAGTPGGMAVAHAVQTVTPIDQLRPEIPQQLANLVMRCLEKQPSQRPQSASELVDELESFSAGTKFRPPSGSRRLSRARIAIGGAAALGVIAFALLWLARAGRDGEVRLAVLPFENLGAPADAYLADGVAEEIGNKLAGVPGLTVIGRSSAAHLKRTGAAPHDIGNRLNADYVLDGSVRWARTPAGEPAVRVLPQLIRVSNAAQIWGEPYEGTLAQVFGLQTEIAEKVAAAVRVRLLPHERSALRRPATASVAAYEQYLLGRHLWKQRGAALPRAAEHFEAAIALDPQFARAYSGLADSYVLIPGFAVTSIPREEAFARAQRAASRAVEIDSTIAESWTSLGLVLLNENLRGAYEAYRKALALDPHYATAHQWYGELLSHVGRYEEAIAAGRRAIDLDPFVAVAHGVLANPHLALGDFRAAEAALERALAVDPEFGPAHFLLARLYLEERRPELARPILERRGLSPQVAAALTRQTRTPVEREQILRELATAPMNEYFKAILLANIGENDAALAYLEQSVRRREPFRNIRGVRAFAPLRDDPRFERILDQAGLSDSKLREAGLRR